MHESIAQFGRDHSQLVIKDNFALGYQSHWMLAEEVNERQPLYNAEHDLWCVFTGRIDNREPLFDSLDLKNASFNGDSDCADLSDAALMMMLYLQLGEAGMPAVIGSYAVLFFSPTNDILFAGRDVMGGRYLCYTEVDTRVDSRGDVDPSSSGTTSKCLIISTYEPCIAKHSAVGFVPEDSTSAYLLAKLRWNKPRCFLKGILEVYPGYKLSISRRALEHSQFDFIDSRQRINLASDQAYADEFKRLLTQAVKRRLRTRHKIGVSLSGGLDSMPICVIAAQELNLRGQSLNAFSYCFKNTSECNESEYSTPLCQQYHIQQHFVECDELWPDYEHLNPPSSVCFWVTPYYAKLEGILRRTEREEVSILLSGLGGDNLFLGGNSLLLEILFKGRIVEFFKLVRSWRHRSNSVRAFISRYFLRPWGGLHELFLKRTFSNAIKNNKLTSYARHQLKFERHWLAEKTKLARRPDQYVGVLDGLLGEDISMGRFNDSKYGLERRYPMRDRDLVEFMLAIPTEQLVGGVLSRPIVRRAFDSDLPIQSRNRADKTSFEPWLNAGIQRDKKNHQYFVSCQNIWSKIVKKEYILNNLGSNSEVDSLKWACGYYGFLYSLYVSEDGSEIDCD